MYRPLAGMLLVPLALSVTGCVGTSTDKKALADPAVAQVEQTTIPSHTGLYAQSKNEEQRLAHADASFWGAKHEADPTDEEAALKFAEALFASDQPNEGLAVLSRTADLLPNRPKVLSAYGKALTRTGKPSQALSYLGLANTLHPSDWTILSAQGVALDLLGDYNQARLKYESALDKSPKNPQVLNNLALSQMQRQDLVGAEQYLRLAVDQPGATTQVRQNLVMVLTMQGKKEEARKWAAKDLPEEMVQTSMAYYAELAGQDTAEPQSVPVDEKPAMEQPEGEQSEVDRKSENELQGQATPDLPLMEKSEAADGVVLPTAKPMAVLDKPVGELDAVSAKPMEPVERETVPALPGDGQTLSYVKPTSVETTAPQLAANPQPKPKQLVSKDLTAPEPDPMPSTQALSDAREMPEMPKVAALPEMTVTPDMPAHNDMPDMPIVSVDGPAVEAMATDPRPRLSSDVVTQAMAQVEPESTVSATAAIPPVNPVKGADLAADTARNAWSSHLTIRATESPVGGTR